MTESIAGIRRVYVLPNSMAALVRAYGAAARLSEVAAVRQLLAEALDRRESGVALCTRAKLMIPSAGLAKTLGMLATHPQVSMISRLPDGAVVDCADGFRFEITGHLP